MLSLLDRELKEVILNMSKKPKDAISKEFMKRMSQQIENINKEIKIILKNNKILQLKIIKNEKFSRRAEQRLRAGRIRISNPEDSHWKD